LYVEGEWNSKQWTRGCYNANFGPKTWTQFGEALARPIGPIKWASSETADVWTGYMEGAVSSGERAAQEVLAVLAERS
jgi:monoamine oxidase